MNKIDPIMFNQAVRQGWELGWKLRKRPTARMAKGRSPPGTASTRKGPGARPTCPPVLPSALCASAARVLTLKHSVPGNCVMAASQLRSRGSKAHHWTGARVYCESASTAVIAGVWACKSWANEAAVKKIEPTKYVTLSAIPPTALTYAGTDPNTNNAEPMMNSHATAALRATGRAIIMIPSRVVNINGPYAGQPPNQISQISLPESETRLLHPTGVMTWHAIVLCSNIRARRKTARVKDRWLGRPSDDDDRRVFVGLD